MSFFSSLKLRTALPPLITLLTLLTLWQLLTRNQTLPKFFPTPGEVWEEFAKEKASGDLWTNITTSVKRIFLAYGLSVLIGVPIGVFLGQLAAARSYLLPIINFLRSVSPISWIPFAIQWFGLGDPPVVFLVFAATFPPIALGTMAAVMGIPKIYFRVGRDYGLTGISSLLQVTLPAILPQLLTTFRVAMGLAWVVLVAAEMISRSTGLGFLIQDARQSLNLELAMVGIIVIGLLGILFDRLLLLLTLLPSVRWGYER
jgi:NitT/TauT family transport system permease protein